MNWRFNFLLEIKLFRFSIFLLNILLDISRNLLHQNFSFTFEKYFSWVQTSRFTTMSFLYFKRYHSIILWFSSVCFIWKVSVYFPCCSFEGILFSYLLSRVFPLALVSFITVCLYMICFVLNPVWAFSISQIWAWCLL